MPTVEAMNKEGRTFKGCLYFGLMITQNGPKVIEYNCRFGDPETQVVLPLLKTDLCEIMQAVEDERLDSIDVEFYDESACCVVMASNGYPVKYESGFELKIPEDIKDNVFVAGAKLDNGILKTAGGRVLGAVARANDLETAIDNAYSMVKRISFDNAYYRNDIGRRALLCSE